MGDVYRVMIVPKEELELQSHAHALSHSHVNRELHLELPFRVPNIGEAFQVPFSWFSKYCFIAFCFYLLKKVVVRDYNFFPSWGYFTVLPFNKFFLFYQLYFCISEYYHFSFICNNCEDW